ncbi:uncharacterized protein LOC105687007 isoform X2 [Athalia rosae]|uniref:uncharacterized protein LOC105687007 isoform X2 n=1 Tax=Athalia rosae TaxID=37344 RepID=UPI002033B0F7|nr:uncharacterized protein LOC105687007 isoform X2 [Athalia rosae]
MSEGVPYFTRIFRTRFPTPAWCTTIFQATAISTTGTIYSKNNSSSSSSSSSSRFLNIPVFRVFPASVHLQDSQRSRCWTSTMEAGVFLYAVAPDQITIKILRTRTIPSTRNWVTMKVVSEEAVQYRVVVPGVCPPRRARKPGSIWSSGDLHPDTDDEIEPSARSRLTNHRRVHASSKAASEDEFAEDELSLGEPSEARMLTNTVGAPAWGTCPAAQRPPRGRRGRSPRSLDRRRKDKGQDVGEFHEGMLLDALLQFYPSVAGVAGTRPSNGQRQQTVPSVAHRLPYFMPQLPAAQALKVEENPYESVPVLGPLHRYTTLGRSGGLPKDRSKCSRYNSEYYGLQNQDIHPGSGGPVYTQVGGDYSDAYSQPTDRLYVEDKYSQPVYYTAREPDQISSGRLYQGQPDSSFGSDSGYSHHTSGTTGTTGTRNSSSRANHRKDKHRNSHHSIDYVVS